MCNPGGVKVDPSVATASGNNNTAETINISHGVYLHATTSSLFLFITLLVLLGFFLLHIRHNTNWQALTSRINSIQNNNLQLQDFSNENRQSEDK